MRHFSFEVFLIVKMMCSKRSSNLNQDYISETAESDYDRPKLKVSSGQFVAYNHRQKSGVSRIRQSYSTFFVCDCTLQIGLTPLSFHESSFHGMKKMLFLPDT